MKIGYLGIKGLPSKAGADRVVEAIVRRLSGRHHITVYCSSRTVPKNGSFDGVKLVRVPVLPGKHAHATSLFTLSAIDSLIRRDFDIIHLHNVEASFILPLLKLKYKVISTSHGQAYARDKWGKVAKVLIGLTDLSFAMFSDRMTSVSKPLAEYYKHRYAKTVSYIPNGIGLEDSFIDLDIALKSLFSSNISPGNYLLFAAGRILRTKGIELLLSAYRTIDSDAKLLIVGDMSHIPGYEKRLSSMADSRVEFLPTVDKPVLLGLLKLARFFIFPSTVEAMSMMLLEAASTGVPIIASNIPENIATLPQQALYFKSGDINDLREKLYWALSNPEKMQKLGIAAKLWVEENHQWDKIIDQYESLYEQVLSGS